MFFQMETDVFHFGSSHFERLGSTLPIVDGAEGGSEEAVTNWEELVTGTS